MNIFKTLFFILLQMIFLSLSNCNPFEKKAEDTTARNALLGLALLNTGSPIVVSTLSLTESGKSDSKLIMNQPEDLTIGNDGNLYVADSKNNRILKITNESTVTAIATSTGNGTTVTVINNPEGITAGPNGLIYVANTGASTATNGAFDGHNIIAIDTANNNTITLLSGKDRPTLRETIDGAQGTNRYFKPEGIRYANSRLIVGENGGYNVREINTGSGFVTTLAGEKVTGGGTPSGGTPIATDGPALSARFNSPKGVVADSKGNVYIADNKNHCIRKYDPTTNTVSTFAGSRAGGTDSSAQGLVDATGTLAKFNGPYMITIDSNDNLYVADAGNYAIRKITPTGVVTTIAGGKGAGRTDGGPSSAQFYNPIGIYYHKNTLYVTDKGKANLNGNTDPNDYSTIRKISNVF
jgi:sugar lactone lactonase YvrE